MNCFYHGDRDVSAICVDCGKGLCQECASAFQPCLCPECASSRSKNATTGEAARIFGKSLAFFVLSFLVVRFLLMPSESSASLSTLLLMSLIFSGIPWGWSLLSRIIPLAPGGNVAFVVGFYLVKLMAAYFIGLIVMLWNVLKISYLLIKRAVEKQSISKA